MLHWTSEGRLFPVILKLSMHIRDWWGKKKMPCTQEQTALAFCQLAYLWELVKSSSASYFNTLTPCSEAAGGAAQQNLSEAGLQKQKASPFHTGWARGLRKAGELVQWPHSRRRVTGLQLCQETDQANGIRPDDEGQSWWEKNGDKIFRL